MNHERRHADTAAESMSASPSEPNLDSGDGVQRLIGLLTEQRDLYQKLEALSQAQHALVTGNDPGRLLDVLSQRQALLDRLGALAEQIRPYQQEWPRVRASLSGEQGKILDRLVHEVNKLLGSIIQRDQADSQLLAARKSAAEEGMQRMQTGKQAGSAYAANAYAASAGRDWDAA